MLRRTRSQKGYSFTLPLVHFDFGFAFAAVPRATEAIGYRQGGMSPDCRKGRVCGAPRRLRVPAMILYHFTLADRAARIRRDGLVPAFDRDAMLGGEEVVWLTELTDLRVTPEQRALFLERTGEVFTRWMYDGVESGVVRLSIKMPTRDRKLAGTAHGFASRSVTGCSRWRTPMIASCSNWPWGCHWIYFGIIPPSKIVEQVDIKGVPGLKQLRPPARTTANEMQLMDSYCDGDDAALESRAVFFCIVPYSAQPKETAMRLPDRVSNPLATPILLAAVNLLRPAQVRRSSPDC